MVISTGTYNSFICNRCGAGKSGERWFCGDCRDDFCLECEPRRYRDPNDGHALKLFRGNARRITVGDEVKITPKSRNFSRNSDGASSSAMALSNALARRSRGGYGSGGRMHGGGNMMMPQPGQSDLVIKDDGTRNPYKVTADDGTRNPYKVKCSHDNTESEWLYPQEVSRPVVVSTHLCFFLILSLSFCLRLLSASSTSYAEDVRRPALEVFRGSRCFKTNDSSLCLSLLVNYVYK
jgi:hypothetical protein